MIKFKETILMLCLLFSGAFCYSNGMFNMGNGIVEGSNVTLNKASHGGPDRSSSIIASVNGHLLTVLFKDYLGEVLVEVTSDSGEPIEGTGTITPTGFQIYFPLAGDYIVYFTLPNGDEYYGEFSVTD